MQKGLNTGLLYLLLVPGAGIEPARPQWPLDFKSSASTNSAIWASVILRIKKSERRDSDPRPRPWQGRALPTELLSLFVPQR